MREFSWSKTEKKIAREAFEKAYGRECAGLIRDIRRRAENMAEPGDVWDLHDFLKSKRKEIDWKYDYRYSVLITVFARLLREKWLRLDDLKGLAQDKIDYIVSLAEWEF